jgi:hypothetical protein
MNHKPALECLDARIVPAIVRGRVVNPYLAEQQALYLAARAQQQSAVQINTTDTPKSPNSGEQTSDVGNDQNTVILGGKMGPKRAPGSYINPLTRPVGVIYKPFYE